MEFFGKFVAYLLSVERRKLFESHPIFGSDDLEERLAQIHHSDVANFQEKVC